VSLQTYVLERHIHARYSVRFVREAFSILTLRYTTRIYRNVKRNVGSHTHTRWNFDCGLHSERVRQHGFGCTSPNGHARIVLFSRRRRNARLFPPRVRDSLSSFRNFPFTGRQNGRTIVITTATVRINDIIITNCGVRL